MPRRKRPSAAALKYNVDSDVAPKVVASGEGGVAEKIIEKAREAQIPIVEDAALVSALLALDLGEDIPAELYHAVAKVLSFVYSIDKNKGAR